MRQDSFNPFFYIIIIITISLYAYIAIYFINKVRTKIPEWSRQHVNAFLFSMGDTRERKKKTWRNVGVRDKDTVDFAMRMQVYCLLVEFLGVSLTFFASAMLFKWQHWM
ncbi:hypothetical protein V5F72_02805 [Xanthobacter flavus]|uniref:hypothetical protein n=1 Tax=Xanthobacter flavus TaxID=281 RepID=UPI00372CA4CE